MFELNIFGLLWIKKSKIPRHCKIWHIYLVLILDLSISNSKPREEKFWHFYLLLPHKRTHNSFSLQFFSSDNAHMRAYCRWQNYKETTVGNGTLTAQRENETSSLTILNFKLPNCGSIGKSWRHRRKQNPKWETIGISQWILFGT
jgi:hypothetical protein